MRIALVLATSMLALVACGPQTPAAKPVVPAAAAKPDPAADQKAKMAAVKAEFDAAGSDETRIGALADNGNGYALLHRAQNHLSSQDYGQQQDGFSDMEAAAGKGVAEAQLWVGQKMAYGTDGYPWKPSSGLIMIEKAASQGNIDAIMAAGLMYEQDGLMRNLEKAKAWYQRGADLGADKAKQALAKLGSGQD
jgi:TPR repeat protein